MAYKFCIAVWFLMAMGGYTLNSLEGQSLSIKTLGSPFGYYWDAFVVFTQLAVVLMILFACRIEDRS